MQALETFTSALRGRMMSVAQNSKQPNPDTQGSALGRWVLYKQLCLAKSEMGLNDRCLSVLSALLSFLPNDELSEKTGLVVFPSNHQLSLRAHGMPESTLRRHLSSLIKAGIITRKDSPTRKRYAHKNNDGSINLAFGFSFAPLVKRAPDISQMAERMLLASKTLKRLRDEVSVIRRDISACFTEAFCETVPVELTGLFIRFRKVVDSIPRRASTEQLTALKSQLEAIQKELNNSLENIDNFQHMSVNAAQNERQYKESLSESLLKSKKEKLCDLKEKLPEMSPMPSDGKSILKAKTLSLDMVLRCCPDINAYASKGIACWRDLFDATKIVSSFLGIVDVAYRDAALVFGREGVSAVVAWILQRSTEIHSPGGYLRALTLKAKSQAFALSELFSPHSLIIQHETRL